MSSRASDACASGFRSSREQPGFAEKAVSPAVNTARRVRTVVKQMKQAAGKVKKRALKMFSPSFVIKKIKDVRDSKCNREFVQRDSPSPASPQFPAYLHLYLDVSPNTNWMKARGSTWLRLRRSKAAATAAPHCAMFRGDTAS